MSVLDNDSHSPMTMGDNASNDNGQISENVSPQVKALMEELAEKEQALVLAAQFGNNLIEEKENLERLMEANRLEQLNKIEKLEQESYELRRQVESMRNEYEAKLYELAEDLHLSNQKLRQNDENKSSQQHDSNEQFLLIQELNDKNQKLIEEIKSNEQKYVSVQESKENLRSKLHDKELLQSENAKMLNSFQKEIAKLLNKQQELEYALMQTCNERDKQSKLIEELTKKYLFVENEKNEMEHLVFQHENEIFNLQRVNQDLIYKIEKFELHSNAMNRKRRSMTTNNLSNFESPLNQSTNQSQISTIKSHINSFNKRNENRFFKETESFNGHQANSSPFRQIDNSNYFHHRSELESVNDLDVFKLNEIEADDDDCEHNQDIDEDADESVDMYTKSAFLETDSSNHFLGAINWQQEAIEQNIQDDDDANENSQESHSHHDLLGRNERRESGEDSQGHYRSMEEDSNHSLLN